LTEISKMHFQMKQMERNVKHTGPKGQRNGY